MYTANNPTVQPDKAETIIQTITALPDLSSNLSKVPHLRHFMRKGLIEKNHFIKEMGF